MVVMMLEVGGVLLLAATWIVAIARMIETRRWSPLRPAVMVIVIAACLVLMGDTLLTYVQTGHVRPILYLAMWNLGMALFDMKIALLLAQRGDIKGAAMGDEPAPVATAAPASARAAYEAPTAPVAVAAGKAVQAA